MSKSTKKQSASRPPVKVEPPGPPVLYTCIMGKHKVRFNNATGVAQLLAPTFNDFADMMFAATSSTVGYRLFDSIRIRKIEMWFVTSSATTAVSAYIEDINLSGTPSVGAPSRTKLASQPTVSENAYLVYVPTKGSVQANWFGTSNSNGQNLLRMSIPAAAIVDITYDFTLADGVDAPTSLARAISGATAGQIYVSKFMNTLTPLGVASV